MPRGVAGGATWCGTPPRTGSSGPTGSASHRPRCLTDGFTPARTRWSRHRSVGARGGDVRRTAPGGVRGRHPGERAVGQRRGRRVSVTDPGPATGRVLRRRRGTQCVRRGDRAVVRAHHAGADGQGTRPSQRRGPAGRRRARRRRWRHRDRRSPARPRGHPRGGRRRCRDARGTCGRPARRPHDAGRRAPSARRHGEQR